MKVKIFDNRKTTLGILALLIMLFAFLSQKKIDATPPNIVIIYADDIGYGDLNCQNPNSKIPTPNLNKLASEGMRFTNAHSSSGICFHFLEQKRNLG